MRNHVIGVIAVVAALAAWPCLAEVYAYQEGFEGDAPALAPWADDGPSTVSFSGPSDEMACEGSRSLKLDITCDGGSYHYFGVPCRFPCAGTLKLSARVYVAEGTTARVGFGINAIYPPTHHSGCGAEETFDGPTNEWKTVEVDLAARGESGAARVLPANTATTLGEDVGAYVDRWALFIYGGEGQRAVVYVDDVRIEGEGPSEAEYEAEIGRRWAKHRERLEARAAEWRAALEKGRAAFSALPELPEAIQSDADRYVESVTRAEELIGKLLERGYGSKEDHVAIEGALWVVAHGPDTLSAMADGLATGQPLLLYAPRAITNQPFTTDAYPTAAPVAGSLECAACPGEYESMSLLVYALEDLDGVRVKVGDLAGSVSSISGEAVDVSVVKCWYQAGKEIGFRAGTQWYVPELLLKDDDLVRADLEKKENYVRSTREDGTQEYLLCSGGSSENLKDVRPVDADTLQPVRIAARTLRQFWLTVHVPEDARPGGYSGEVLLFSSRGVKTLPIYVTVRSFALLPPSLTYSIYYRAKLAADGTPTIGSEYKSEEQYRAEIEDMKAHGVLYPTNYQGYDDTLLRRALEIRRDVGLPAGRFFTLGQSTGCPDTPEGLADLAANVKKWIAFCGPFGYDSVYFYGIDEATGDRLKAQRDAWKAVQDAGGKTFVACYTETFEAMGDLLDCAVLAGRPDPEEAAKYHGVGSEAFCYAYPQVGNEEPETYRRNFGLVLWKSGFDGAMDYAYQHGFGHIWNDFDNATYRDHNFTYPTVHGVVGTIQWEGFREAVDDVRYAATLEKAIADAPEHKAAVAAEARSWLDALDPAVADLYAVRNAMADFIRRLM